jgi:hypothetical protein
MIVSVSTACPFCSGSVVLMRERTELTNAELVSRYSGNRVACQQPGCERTFVIRRHDVLVHRSED